MVGLNGCQALKMGVKSWFWSFQAFGLSGPSLPSVPVRSGPVRPFRPVRLDVTHICNDNDRTMIRSVILMMIRCNVGNCQLQSRPNCKCLLCSQTLEMLLLLMMMIMMITMIIMIRITTIIIRAKGGTVVKKPLKRWQCHPYSCKLLKDLWGPSCLVNLFFRKGNEKLEILKKEKRFWCCCCNDCCHRLEQGAGLK